MPGWKPAARDATLMPGNAFDCCRCRIEIDQGNVRWHRARIPIQDTVVHRSIGESGERATKLARLAVGPRSTGVGCVGKTFSEVEAGRVGRAGGGGEQNRGGELAPNGREASHQRTSLDCCLRELSARQCRACRMLASMHAGATNGPSSTHFTKSSMSASRCPTRVRGENSTASRSDTPVDCST